MGYIEDCKRSESTVFNLEKGDDRLLHAGIGIATESGEFLDALKKHVFYGKELDRTNLKEEAGDLLWYVAIALDELGTSFEEVQDINIKKLKARYPEKFTSENAENRDLVEERKILEGKDTEPLKVGQRVRVKSLDELKAIGEEDEYGDIKLSDEAFIVEHMGGFCGGFVTILEVYDVQDKIFYLISEDKHWRWTREMFNV